MSLYGGLQPAKLSVAFPDTDDTAGLMGRFLFAVPEIRTDGGDISPDEIAHDRFQDVLSHLYTVVNNMELGEVKFSKAAERVFLKFRKKVFDLEQDTEHTNPAYMATISKSPGQAMRLALVLHHIECVYEDRTDAKVLHVDTLQRAISLVVFYLNQYKKIQLMAHPESSIDGLLLKVQQVANSRYKRGKSTTTQDIMSSTLGKTQSKNGFKMSAGDIRGYFVSLAETGFGEVCGEGTKVVYTPFEESQAKQNLASRVAEVDTTELRDLCSCLEYEMEVESREPKEEPDVLDLEEIEVGDLVYEVLNPGTVYRVLYVSDDNQVQVQDQATGEIVENFPRVSLKKDTSDDEIELIC
jgi:hypothetical protein